MVMETEMSVRSLGFAGPALDVRGVALRAWGTVGAVVRVRETRRQLAEMDARMLADIGVDQASARYEADRAFWDLHR